MLQGTKKVIAKHNFCNKNMLIKIKERMQGFQKLACTYIICTGKSLSEALILGSTNPQYDKRLFIDLPVQYMKTTSSEHVLYINCSKCQNIN